MSSRFSQTLQQAIRLYDLLERWTIVLMMVLLVLFALYQIVLRNFFSTGIVWGDIFLRHVVLWIGFLGACRATAEDKHIHIDLSAMISTRWLRSLLGLLRVVFLSAVCTVLFYASWIFLGDEKSSGYFAFLDIPYWWLQAIFPLSFLVMTLRSLSQLWRNLRTLAPVAHA
ncbi:MAG: TRAP transporter small permease [Syntrophobacteraceae bacterium]|nr:TRAP transporter small permease [Syntrophobacteraceae bacterium]